MKRKPGVPHNKYCRGCAAICCRNLALAIGKPANRKEIDDLKWQLHFTRVKIYIRHHHWYQWIKSKCMYLSEDNKCIIYERRPDICRKHNPPDCEKFGKFYDIMISTPEELEAYLEAKKKNRQKSSGK
ncbi:MAG: YkgJ family cysteine cluster protein [Candidatus Omnitrophica bacterium]|nr:YkgJ family cysteine cluster protein [Candidatus Omnitrophota bacterium]